MNDASIEALNKNSKSSIANKDIQEDSNEKQVIELNSSSLYDKAAEKESAAKVRTERRRDRNAYKGSSQETPDRAKNNTLYYWFFKLCSHALFTVIITLCILANTILLAMDRYPIRSDELQYLDDLNEVFTYIFLVEMIIKLIGLGFN